MPQFGGASEKCTVCAKTVYLAEKIVVEDKDEKKTFHKTCLKCSHCKATLSLGNYASMNGVFYCKPHFKQLFATKGNYDEGFGKDKLTSKWAPNAPPAASTVGTFVPVEKEEISAPKPSEKKDSPASVPGRFGSSEKCEKCSKTVYATEKIVVEEKDGKKVYHKTCLRCAHCQNLLTLGNYASMNGITYCKPHFKQLFAAKGNYDEGFGKEKHTTKWETTTSTSPAPSSFVPVEKTDTPKESKAAPVSEVANKFKGMSTTDKCTACGKNVYLTERTVVEDKEDKKVFHKNCLRCTHCSVVLSLGSYASMGGVMYCKPHFKQLFASKGNYDEGFGKEKHSAKWTEKDGEPREESKEEPKERSQEHHHEEHGHKGGHEEHHKEHTSETTSSGHEHHDDHEHKHDDHEHKHDDHEHKHDDHEHKHDDHEHKHDDHEHEHKHDDHEHHHHHEEGDEHHHEGKHQHEEGEHHHHEGEHHHHEGEHHHEHEHEHEHEEKAQSDEE